MSELSYDNWTNCFGHNASESVRLENPKTLPELLAIFDADSNSEEVVWRGQSNMMWAPFPTLYRRLRLSGFADAQINESLIRWAETRIIEDAKRQSLVGEGPGSVTELMACLQHYGGATRLLDVTSNPYVALYFASGGELSSTGVVCRYRVNPEKTLRLEEKAIEWDELLGLAEGGRALHVVPRAYDRRIEVQSASFLMASIAGSLAEPSMFTHQTYDTEVHHVMVLPQLKEPLRRYLAGEGINQRSLFPSIEGFAKEHSVNASIKSLL